MMKQDHHERYKSTVVHLPLHIVTNSPLVDHEEYLDIHKTPTKSNEHANVQSIIVVDELAQYLTMDEAPHPTIDIQCLQLSSQKQTTLLWSMIALFAISIIISTMLFAQKSITVLYVIQIVCALCGLLLAYFYNANMHFTYSLSNKIDALLSEQKHLRNEANELEKKLEEKQNEQAYDDGDHKIISLLESFCAGDFHKQLAYCATKDIKQLLPVIAFALCQLPFGLTQFRSNLFVILAQRISTDPSLDQAWRFFLNSYGDIASIHKYWAQHEYYLQHDDDSQEDYKSAIDSVRWFKSLTTDLSEIHSTKSIDSSKFLCDPINGNILVKVELISSPYIINCYTLNNKFSSCMILKCDQDLRKDLGIILMLKYFNQIWKENNNIYNKHLCQAITFEVCPMSQSFGCIESVHIEKDVNNIMNTKQLNMNKLIATAAGCYLALYICGVKNNDGDIMNIIGIRTDCGLLQSDYSHAEIFTTAAAANELLTNWLKKILDDNQWNEFVQVVVQCFDSLRKNYIHILDYSRIVFGFMQQRDENENYLKESLLINVKEEDALIAVQKMLSIN